MAISKISQFKKRKESEKEMANFEMNRFNGETYEPIYPKTKSDNIITSERIKTNLDLGENTTIDEAILKVKQIAEESPFIVSSTPPTDVKKFWIDTTLNTGGLKYFIGGKWVNVPIGNVK